MDMDYSGLLLTVVIVGLLVLAGWATRWLEQRRMARLRDVARELGFELATQAEPELCQSLEDCMLLGSGHSAQIGNLMWGKIGAQHVALFDFCYATGSGKGRKTWTQTVLQLRFEGPGLPQFALRPETTMEQWWGLSSGVSEDINFPNHPEFSRTYLLNGKDTRAVRKLFTDAVLEGFEQRHGLSVEGNGNTLLIYRHDLRTDPSHLGTLVDEGMAVLRLLTGQSDSRHADPSSVPDGNAAASAIRVPTLPVPPLEPTSRRLLRLALAVVWFGIVTASVLTLRLSIVGYQKLTNHGVTTLNFRQRDILIGLGWGFAVSFVLWFLSGRYLIARPAAHDAFARKRARSIATPVLVLCGILTIAAVNTDISLRLDADGIETCTLFAKRQIRFDDVSDLLLTETHSTDRKGHPRIDFSADFHRKNGRTEEWSASTIFQVEAELRDILQRRSITLIDRAPNRRTSATNAVPEASEAEKAAAFKKYMQPIIEQQHQSLHGTRWRWSVGKEREFETTLEFTSEDSITIEVNKFSRTPVKYSATYERTGEWYRFGFEDGTTLEATLQMLGGEGFMFGNPVVTGGGSAATAKEEFTHVYGRQP